MLLGAIVVRTCWTCLPDALSEVGDERVLLITLLDPAPEVAHDHLGTLVFHPLRDEHGVFTARK